MNNGILLCIFTALGFGAWPLLARVARVNDAWATTIVLIVTTFGVTLVQKGGLQNPPSLMALGLLALGGAANAVGMLAYGKLVADTQFQVSSLAPAALIGMIAVIAIGGIVFFHESLTWTKGSGICLALVGAWLLTK